MLQQVPLEVRVPGCMAYSGRGITLLIYKDSRDHGPRETELNMLHLRGSLHRPSGTFNEATDSREPDGVVTVSRSSHSTIITGNRSDYLRVPMQPTA